ncbi:hypothetical protein DL98DRAFT_531692 [Cadophora sp. DSE1049]|nr:hypothetical protein DL98DRAFT_531692 [Cadophora sp. DSE1049]
MSGHQQNSRAPRPFDPSSSTAAARSGNPRNGAAQLSASQPLRSSPATPRPVTSSSGTPQRGFAQTATPGSASGQNKQRGTRHSAIQGATPQIGPRRAAISHHATSKAASPRNPAMNTTSRPTTTSPAAAPVGTVAASGTPSNTLPPLGLRSAQSNTTFNIQAQAHPIRTLMDQTTSSDPAGASHTTLVPSKDAQGASEMAEATTGKDDEEEFEDEVLLHQLIRSVNMVKIYVGAEKRCWTLHEDALCHYSEYFKKAFQRNFTEAEQKSIALEEEDSITFGRFVDWIYTGSVECALHPKKSHIKQPKEHFLLYICLEIFADKYLMPGLSECAVVEWEKCHTEDVHIKPFVDEVKFIFENCPEKSTFRDLAVFGVLSYYLTDREQDYVYMGQVLSCNPFFAEKFAQALKEHQELKFSSRCWIDSCSLHPDVEASKPDSANKRQRVN